MLLNTIAEYGAQDAVRRLPGEVIHHAKRAFLDWLSALYPGTRTAPCRQLLNAHRIELGAGASSLPGCGTTAFAPTAAWINGSVSHAVEFDDIYRDAIYHPGCPTIAAALALAEEQNASGLALLQAIVVGYEISTRIGAAVQPAHYRFFHTTGTVGCFGSAAAAAALRAPGNAEVMMHALATAGTLASGLQQAFRSDAMSKALHAGHAAEVGVRAGLGAAHGITGVADILEGEVGFGAALAGHPDWSVATAGFGQRYNIASITQKNHGCCGHTFAAIDAALALRAGGLRSDDIATLRVDAYQTALDVTGNFHPATAFEAKFSLPYVVAHALVHGSVRLDAFGPARLEDAQVRELMRKLQLVADPDLSAGFPKTRAARLTITTRSGAVLKHFSPYRKGDPESPLSDADLNDKFAELAGPVLGSERTQALCEAVWRMDGLSVRALRLAADRPRA
ncbi:MmgE/PrpD family protein [Bordetella genomosp. 12]|uniref:2-methylcitrate dehydratase n=1 Tax=Bordetella genomosp. 12 TaxID=463035 RepID=A0A261VBV1_9BORD|nr:MmgE/PrpD family protein [Bordetella genomosp. 12]OZI71569.1 2-methylcitrate dehydratase [Bordetella genomosp. 12]